MLVSTLSRIYIAGHRRLVGAALAWYFQHNGFNNLPLQTRGKLDLTSREAVWSFLRWNNDPSMSFLQRQKSVALPPPLIFL